ncbi:MAG: hypothetical protein A2W80_06345 [Candidatus Riflebacteria bacterium GWC2_50_8]|nr:MAG: hypothetical protein A2W80_06345 [Candidatus Riflebacteria bacterium GWC2_50_8]
MLQPSHRGIYEYLWSEHKYSMIGISLKIFQGMAARLGKKPQILNWLRRLAVLATEERPEWYNALLNVYMHIKPELNRAQRHEIIELLLVDEPAAAELLYKHALRLNEKSMYGCRLFFKGTQALYKFWDAQDRPGLWLCFGPFQLHLTAAQVFSRIAISSATTADELHGRFQMLNSGIREEEFLCWPETLRDHLLNNNLVVMPGSSAILHPRARILLSENTATALQVDNYTTAALILEKLWDNAEYPDDAIAQLPQHRDFLNAFRSWFVPEVEWQNDFCAEEAWDFIAGVFWQQKCAEAGQPVISDDSSADIGMEPADEEIDSEEGEHGDEEPRY